MNEGDCYGDIIEVNICLRQLEDLVQVIKSSSLTAENSESIRKNMHKYRELEEFLMLKIQKLVERPHDIASLTEINLNIDRLNEYGVDFQSTWNKKLWSIYEEEVKIIEASTTYKLETKLLLIYQMQKNNRELHAIAEVSASNEVSASCVVSQNSNHMYPVTPSPIIQSKHITFPNANKQNTLTDESCKCIIW